MLRKNFTKLLIILEENFEFLKKIFRIRKMSMSATVVTSCGYFMKHLNIIFLRMLTIITELISQRPQSKMSSLNDYIIKLWIWIAINLNDCIWNNWMNETFNQCLMRYNFRPVVTVVTRAVKHWAYMMHTNSAS